MKQFIYYTLLLALSGLMPATLYAQYNLPENKVWIFGEYNGIDFNGATPKALVTNMHAGRAGAAVCDTSGKLLFYTDGMVAWNQNAQPMPNGDSIGPSYYDSRYIDGNADGALIVGMPDSANKYYVFSSGFLSVIGTYGFIPLSPPRLFYSVVDMELDNGLGDVLPKRKWILLDSSLGTTMTTVPGNNCNVWLIVHGSDSNMFKAYEITWKGINPSPVISYANTPFTAASMAGQMTISPDRKTLACGWGDFAELYDFDPATGQVSNGWVVDSSGQGLDIYGICFSPDNSKLYINHTFPAGTTYIVSADIYQVDLSLGNHAAIRYSINLVGHNQANSELRLAGNDKIYFIRNAPGTILQPQCGSIEFPNLYGAACQLKNNGISGNLNYAGEYAGMGDEFVKAIPNPYPDSVAFTQLDTCVQANGFKGFTLHVPQGDYIDYTWDDNTIDTQRIVTRPGTYSVTCIDRCMNVSKAIYSIKPLPYFTLGADTTVCTLPISLKADVTDASYLWSTGNTADSIQVFSSGTYWATLNKNECAYTDSIQVTHLDVRQDLGKDLSICKDEAVEINLSANVPDDARALWNTGSTTADIVARDTGIYWVTVTDLQCTGSDTLHIAGEPCDCRFAAPTAFSPNGDGTNDFFRLVIERNCPVQSYSIVIYNRWGQKVYTGNNLETGWDGTSNGQPQDIGTYSYIVEFSVGTKSNHYFQKGEVTLIR